MSTVAHAVAKVLRRQHVLNCLRERLEVAGRHEHCRLILIDELRNGHVFGSCSLTIVLHDPDPERLERHVAACAKVCARYDGVLHDESFNLLNAWLAVLPGNGAHNLRRLALLNTTAADLAPVFGIAAGARPSEHLRADGLITLETREHTPYFWALHHADVGHTVVLGATGSGKSFLLNVLMTHAQQYDRVTVVSAPAAR